MNLFILLFFFGLASADNRIFRSYPIENFDEGSMITFYFKYYGPGEVYISFVTDEVEAVKEVYDQRNVVAHVKLHLERDRVLITNYQDGGKWHQGEVTTHAPNAPTMCRCDLYKLDKNKLLTTYNGYWTDWFPFDRLSEAKTVYLTSPNSSAIEWDDPEIEMVLWKSNRSTLPPLTEHEYGMYRDHPSRVVTLKNFTKGFPVGATFQMAAMMTIFGHDPQFRWFAGFHTLSSPSLYPLVIGQKADDASKSVYLYSSYGDEWIKSKKCLGDLRELEHIRFERTAIDKIVMTIFYHAPGYPSTVSSFNDFQCEFESHVLENLDKPLGFEVTGGTMILNMDHNLDQYDANANH